MNILQAGFLGILQGLTEFLPVSSSGHLVLAQNFMPGFDQPGVLFDVFLHLGTLLAIVFYFKKAIFNLSWDYLKLILLATIPAAVVGFFFSDIVENLFTSTAVVGFALLVTAGFNFFTDKAKKAFNKLDIKSAIWTGVFQALALVPGISRSGATIFAATKKGIARSEAAQFSFILSVPAVLGGSFLQVMKYGVVAKQDALSYLVGFLMAFVSGYLAIGVVMKLLTEKRFKIFALYCLVVGFVAILL